MGRFIAQQCGVIVVSCPTSQTCEQRGRIVDRYSKRPTLRPMQFRTPPPVYSTKEAGTILLDMMTTLNRCL